MIFTPWQKYKVSKAQKANLGLRKSIGYQEASYFGIVFHNDEQSKIDAADKLAALLKMDSKKVKTIAYEHKSSIKHLPYDTISKQNFDFWGGFLGKPVTDFTTAEFDFLICLDEQPNMMVQSVLANSQAKCRVGRYNEQNQQTFEMLLIDHEIDGITWIDKLYQYLKKLA